MVCYQASTPRGSDIRKLMIYSIATFRTKTLALIKLALQTTVGSLLWGWVCGDLTGLMVVFFHRVLLLSTVVWTGQVTSTIIRSSAVPSCSSMRKDSLSVQIHCLSSFLLCAVKKNEGGIEAAEARIRATHFCLFFVDATRYSKY